MSMHFAPQWVKPIKPAGSSATTPNATEIQPSALNPHPVKQAPSQPQVPFPALTPSDRPSPVSATTAGSMAQRSYSRATHTPASPSYPTDGSYFPTDDNGTSPNPHPFRYSREQILGLYDEDKFKSTPIELVELLEQKSVLVSPHINRPIAMRELTDTEKKVSPFISLLVQRTDFSYSPLPFIPSLSLVDLNNRLHRPQPPTKVRALQGDGPVQQASPVTLPSPTVVVSATSVGAMVVSWALEASSLVSLEEER